MKFFKLFKKELKELLTLSSIIGLIAGVAIFVLLGNVMGDMGEKVSESNRSVVICNQDNSPLSKLAISIIEKAEMKVTLIDGTDDKELVQKAFAIDEHKSVLVIPKGFEAGINSGIPQEVKVVNSLKSFSMMNSTDDSASKAQEILKVAVSDTLIKSSNANANIEFLKNPVTKSEITVVKGKSAPMNSQMLMSIAMQQSIFIPIIVFILITFASQLNSAAIANEKTDKTLETLLSAPVSRLAVIGSKMAASGVFSLVMAVVYMFGFSSYMNGMTGASGAASPTATVLSQFGLKMGVAQYALLGVQLFLTLLIALTISMILGALAKDLKSAQTLTMPLMFLTMIPYFVSMMMDINSLPKVAQVLINLIPFTHTFTASTNILFGNTAMFFGGMIYQVAILALVLFLAVRVFSGDKIFTMTIDFGKKKAKKISV